ncbi:MBL fold metallo-hydrolase [Pontibacter vulgaris]|uniref:MBL fold metallo-hydrolase n=1 Tax=Pontibacter vulgaris TaxID=2905679 RepID=UPI001FA73650|nr:MBL fold metallo-hydrolase [Pontibacter vulgaris]
MQKIIQLAVYPYGMINCFLIKGEKKHILVDAGLPGSEKTILKQLQKLGIKKEDIDLLIITHGHIDHFGSAKALKDELKIPVLMHELDSRALETGKSLRETLKPNKIYWNILKRKLLRDKAIPCTPDIILKGDEEFNLTEWGINGKIAHTPGHTPGTLSIVMDSGDAIIMDLASSGILLGGIAFHSRMKHPPFHDDLEQVKASINRVLSMNTNRFYLGHGHPVTRESLIVYRDTFL